MTTRPVIAIDSSPDATSPLVELEARHDEALRQLAELELRIEAVLKEVLPPDSLAPASQPPAEPSEVLVQPGAPAIPAAAPPVDQADTATP